MVAFDTGLYESERTIDCKLNMMLRAIRYPRPSLVIVAPRDGDAKFYPFLMQLSES